MRINRVLFLATTLLVMSYTPARADNWWTDENGNSCHADSGCVYVICPRIYCKDNSGATVYGKHFSLDTSGYKGDKSDISYEDVNLSYDNKTDTWSFYNPNTGKYQEFPNDFGIYNNSDSYLGYDGNGNKISERIVDYNANGNVKSSSQSSYEYDGKGNQTSYNTIYYDANGKVTSSSQSSAEYDGKGNQTSGSSVDYDADENVTASSQWSSEYYENGYLKSEHSESTGTDGSSSVVNFEYYEDGTWKSHKREEHTPDGGYSIDTQWDENGHTISDNQVNYNKDGSVLDRWQWSYEYNEDESFSRSGVCYDANGNIIGTDQSSVEYEFDENGDIIGERDSYYTYDEQGRIIEKVEEYYNSFGEHTLDYKLYEYNADGSYNVYDENNELVGKYNADGSPKVGKRIYTVEEATAAVSGKGKNTFIIRYR